MTDDRSDVITTLERQEAELIFTSFDHADAWRFGARITGFAATASGLSTQEDHDLVVEGIRQHLAASP